MYYSCDFDAAVSWAFKMQWEFQSDLRALGDSVVLIRHAQPDDGEPDAGHLLHDGSEFWRMAPMIPANLIREVIPVTDEVLRSFSARKNKRSPAPVTATVQ